MANTFVINAPQTSTQDRGEVILTPRQAAFIENPPKGAVVRIVRRREATPPEEVPPTRVRFVRRRSYVGSAEFDPTELAINKLRELGFSDIQIEGDYVIARGEVPVTLQLPEGANPLDFVGDPRLIGGGEGVEIWKGTSEGTVKFKLTREGNKITLKPVEVHTEAEKAIEEYNARLQSALKTRDFQVEQKRPSPPKRVIEAHMPEALRPENEVAQPQQPRLTSKPVSFVVRADVNPEVASEIIHRSLELRMDSHIPDAFIPTKGEIEAQLTSESSPTTEATYPPGVYDVTLEDIETKDASKLSIAQFQVGPTQAPPKSTYIDWGASNATIDVYKKPSTSERVKETLEDFGEKFVTHLKEYKSLGPVAPFLALFETGVDALDEQLRVDVADTPPSATAKGFARAVVGVLTFPVDAKRAVEVKLGLREPPKTYVPEPNDFVNAQMYLKMKGLEKYHKLGSAMGTVVVMGAPSVVEGVQLARSAFKPDMYEVTYTLGRAKGQIYSRRGTKVFDITAQQKELVTELPKDTLSKNMRVFLEIRPVKTSGGIKYAVVGAKHEVPASIYVPKESKLHLEFPVETEMATWKGGTFVAGTMRRPNVMAPEGGWLRFTLSDYGKTIAAKHTVQSLGQSFGRARTMSGIAEGTWATGRVELSIPVGYEASDFANHPLASLAKDLGTMPTVSHDELEYLITKALTKYGGKAVTSVKPVVKEPTVKVPFAITTPSAEASRAEVVPSKGGGMPTIQFSKQEAPARSVSFELPTTATTVPTQEEVVLIPLSMPSRAEERAQAPTLEWRLDVHYPPELEWAFKQKQKVVQEQRVLPRVRQSKVMKSKVALKMVEPDFSIRKVEPEVFVQERRATLRTPREQLTIRFLTQDLRLWVKAEAPQLELEDEVGGQLLTSYYPLGRFRPYSPKPSEIKYPHPPSFRWSSRRKKTKQNKAEWGLKGWQKTYGPLRFDFNVRLGKLDFKFGG